MAIRKLWILAELDCLTQACKLAVPLGSCPLAGGAAFLLGGGEGPLTARFIWTEVNCHTAFADAVTGKAMVARANGHQTAVPFELDGTNDVHTVPATRYYR